MHSLLCDQKKCVLQAEPKFHRQMQKYLFFILISIAPQFVFSQTYFTHDYLVHHIINNKRWHSDIKIYIYGNCTKENRSTITETIDYFNSILETIQIELVDQEDLSNCVIYFLTDTEYKSLFSWSDHSDNIGATYTKKSLDNDSTLIGSKIHIDTDENEKYNSFRSTIKHEMFHMLGFKHHRQEGNSILVLNKFTEKDEEMIKYLYSNDFNF